MNYILSMNHHQATLENVGGKGMSLSKMLAAGLPVPDGFHLTTEAYRLFVNTNEIQPQIIDALDGLDPGNTAKLEAASLQISNIFTKGVITDELKKEITAAYQKLGNVPVAVRSSATAEDLPGASFAGQQDTYLNIQGESEVLTAVKRCWASLWTARAISYRLLNHIDQATVALAVTVQKLVFSDAAGVLFTVNPVNGDRDEMLINAAWGLGEAIVSSLVTPDTIVVSKTSEKISSYETADKQLMTIRTAKGTEEVPVSDSMRQKPALTENQVEVLTKLGKIIEQYYQMPMDVEWALEKNQMYIVQARPITVLPPQWKPLEKGVIYTKGSLAEHLPSPVTPLFATLGMDLINQATHILWNHMFEDGVQKLWPRHGAYVTINGYTYMSCRFKPFLLITKSFSPKSIRRTYQKSVERSNKAQKEFAAVVTEWESKPMESMSAEQLLNGVRTVFGAACTYFTKIQLCLPAALTSETLLTKLFKGTAAKAGVPDISVLLLGMETIALQSEKSLYKIGKWVSQYPDLSNYLRITSAADISRQFTSAVPPSMISDELWTQWKKQIQLHFLNYGRTAYEFDFSNPTPQEVLTPTFESIKSFATGQGESPLTRQAEAKKRRVEAAKAISNQLNGPRKKLFLKLLGWAQKTAPMREDVIFTMGMGHPVIRIMLNEVAQRLIKKGALSQPDEIYWLNETELSDLVNRLDRRETLQDMTGTIPGRREEWKKNQSYTSPPEIPEKKKKKKNAHSNPEKPEIINGNTVLYGIGTSFGTVTAPACVLYGPTDFEKFNTGDILIAVTTTPAWTPLFASASAVVTDIGGPLSHSSIVAREYGIPAVMATHSATRKIQTGQIITVDGKTGTVMIHEK
ncbi:pyruvate, phosphate dikinase [Enterocloster clostridioformis]|uniref:PEP/pyruvate-binding domain-containing protein n=1 Tax=Enterocloster clostridioformis TaxID=1531 RepID=UPI00080C76CE|nr:PEP/pyruvate-binding domain-containing protein [Enterocloster clostridioformis]ANU44626.1 pyruvate, phosphate dikinase [Lachnoclostridium sp. YL32]NDO28010.1 pyruvate, phosphate dikinase [Enterocloster clostridioformis]OXE70464.1 pyruvate, phosphate dikinase [Enterocloster clostridioformis]QQR00619.1 pyruvate, phosphate dikinase [Enterocloster clostridioformis]